MKKNAIQLNRIVFYLRHGSTAISVVWTNLGRGELNGRTWARVYKVEVDIAGHPELYTYRTSHQANISNTTDYIKKHLL